MDFVLGDSTSFRRAEVLARVLFCLILCYVSHGDDSDVSCLKSIKESLVDPYNYLKWNFENNSAGFICSFYGITCWNYNENKVLSINVQDLALQGQFPRGLKNCTSLTSLDLSNNNLHGPLPVDIGTITPFLTSLSLSFNNFSGAIPSSLASCKFLNRLMLDHNDFSGQIPLQLGMLSRLRSFSVADNRLYGPVPTFVNATLKGDSFANNVGLCGAPLSSCKSKNRTALILGATIGALGVAAACLGIALCFFLRILSLAKKKVDSHKSKWTQTLKGAHGAKVSFFENSVRKMSLRDLMRATNNFSEENILGSVGTGTIYKATFDDSTLMVKRLQHSQYSREEFMSEMATLGNLKHPNLVSLLGFCAADKERFLIYEFLPNGSLHDSLRAKRIVEWPTRLRIALGAAEGLAWLHHGCASRIIHRNISSKCIMLDGDLTPKISDFGLARLMNPVDTHLSTAVNGEFGEFGYVAPEYSATLTATPKGDVYSFGVVLLELVTGEEATHVAKPAEGFKGNLVEWVARLSSENKVTEAVAECLRGKGADEEVLQVLKVACGCVLSGAKERPTMFLVYQLLRAIAHSYDFSAAHEASQPLRHADVDADVASQLIVARHGCDSV